MKTINNVQAIPNQEFTVTEGDYTYTIHLFDCGTFMAYDLAIDGEYICYGYRVVRSQLLIPYAYQEVDGNFIIDIPADEDLDYEQFNDTQFVRYLSQDEADSWREALRNGEY